jgi:hypothetical protein
MYVACLVYVGCLQRGCSRMWNVIGVGWWAIVCLCGMVVCCGFWSSWGQMSGGGFWCVGHLGMSISCSTIG